MKRIIETEHAPAAIGPYSQAVETTGTLYVSGQLPIDPETGEMKDSIEEQTARAGYCGGGRLYAERRRQDHRTTSEYLGFWSGERGLCKVFQRRMPGKSLLSGCCITKECAYRN